MNESPLFRDLPQSLLSNIVEQLREFSVGFTRAVPAYRDRRVELIGSGTLVKAGDRYAILTAHHVLEDFPRGPRLGLLLDSANQMTSIDQHGLRFLDIARGRDDSEGPDIGAVILAEPVASALRAQKRFFDLGFHRESMLNSPLPDEHGLWVANGFVDELTRRGPEGGIFHVTFRNQSLMGIVERCPMIGEFDYFNVPVDVEERATVPGDFGGMSGGGLWQLQIAQSKDGTLSSRQPKLSGLVFYQLPTTDTQCGLRCHGRRSVYETAYAAILGMGD
ncbi:MAG TPA: hypothetical protein VFR18_06695 [Terriglobia bacterium]|nr:hypothetical protein [Terriglobia bacterium]